MICLILYFYITSCIDTMFVVFNKNSFTLFIGMENTIPSRMHACWYLKELAKEDVIDNGILPYQKRSTQGRNYFSFYFKPINNTDLLLIDQLLKNFNCEDKNQMRLREIFNMSKLILKTNLPKSNSTFYIDLVKSTNYPDVDQILTSGKLNFREKNYFYEFEWLNTIRPEIENNPVSLYFLNYKFLYTLKDLTFTRKPLENLTSSRLYEDKTLLENLNRSLSEKMKMEKNLIKNVEIDQKGKEYFKEDLI